MAFKERVLDKLERMGLTDLRKHTVVEDVLTPIDLERLYNSNRGSIYGVVSDWKKNQAFKAPKQSSKYRNLFFTGGTVNPGGGMPMAIPVRAEGCGSGREEGGAHPLTGGAVHFYGTGPLDLDRVDGALLADGVDPVRAFPGGARSERKSRCAAGFAHHSGSQRSDNIVRLLKSLRGQDVTLHEIIVWTISPVTARRSGRAKPGRES